MKKHIKKMIAPLIISILLIAYFLFLIFILTIIPDTSLLVKCLLILIPMSSGGVMIGVLISRIKEIKGGEEDDLSKY